MIFAASAVLSATDPVGLAEACSTDPGNACRWAYEATGNRQFAEFVDWFDDVPLHILGVLLVAWVVNRLARRVIRRFGERIQGFNEKDGVRKFRSRAPSVFVSTGEVNVRSAA